MFTVHLDFTAMYCTKCYASIKISDRVGTDNMRVALVWLYSVNMLVYVYDGKICPQILHERESELNISLVAVMNTG